MNAEGAWFEDSGIAKAGAQGEKFSRTRRIRQQGRKAAGKRFSKTETAFRKLALGTIARALSASFVALA